MLLTIIIIISLLVIGCAIWLRLWRRTDHYAISPEERIELSDKDLEQVCGGIQQDITAHHKKQSTKFPVS